MRGAVSLISAQQKLEQNTNTLDQPVGLRQTRGPRGPFNISLIIWGSPEVLCSESTKTTFDPAAYLLNRHATRRSAVLP